MKIILAVCLFFSSAFAPSARATLTAAPAGPTETNAYAFPVPFRPTRGHTQITFQNLPSGSRIRVYTVTGRQVVELNDTTGNGALTWNVKNTDGDNVASGVYLWVIDAEGGEKTGKLVVIR